MDIATFPESIEWLSQFDHDDRETATLLLRRLRCISPTLLNNELRGLFEHAATSLAQPIALYAAREMEPEVAYFKNKRDRPVAVLAKEVGSEGSAAYLATTLTRERPAVFLNHPPISTLKRKKCRNIIIFDDICGSGKRAADFISSILLSKTLKSWLSGGFIRFHVLAYAISGKAEDRVLSAFGGRQPQQYVDFCYSQRLATGLEIWSKVEHQRIVTLCKKYGQRHKIRGCYWLGFGNCVSTLVFSHSCPNTVPGILWKKTPSWTPLFPERSIPAGLIPLFTDTPSDFQQSAILQGLNAETVSRSRLFVEGSQREKELLLVLAAIRVNCRTTEFISIRTGMSISRTEELLALCDRFGLIDDARRLTQGGRDGLKIAEERAKIREYQRSTSRMYFPTSLRPRGGQ
jgi:hypothetical protein